MKRALSVTTTPDPDEIPSNMSVEVAAPASQLMEASEKALLPAEWDPHEATWIAWPHNAKDWPGKLSAVRWAYVEMARKITPGERLRILAPDQRGCAQASRMLRQGDVDLSRIDFFQIPTNRSWTRDSGPIFVRTREGLRIARFRFNAWARYADWELDDAVPEQVAKAIGSELLVPLVNGVPPVLEGGAVDVNGRGTLLASEECLLDPVVQTRNPGLSKVQLEELFRNILGARRVIWLGRGIAGDDTHGHVDDFCRFVNPTTLLLARQPDPGEPDHAALEENRERLESARLEDGSRFEIVRLPMPSPLKFAGQRLPASYANFYISNKYVLVPTFNDPADRTALATIQDCFPDRVVAGIHAVDLVWGFGTIHCLTQQQPGF